MDFGATPGDETDDTAVVNTALAGCSQAGGGTVSVPAGVFFISREGLASPVLALPANTTLCGEGTVSSLRFSEGASASHFWRMLGNGPGGLWNLVMRDPHLDGGNTLTESKRGMPEQRHGIFLYDPTDSIGNILSQNDGNFLFTYVWRGRLHCRGALKSGFFSTDYTMVTACP